MAADSAPWRDALVARLPLFYVFLSGLGFSIQSLIVKLLRELYEFNGSFQCVFARGMVQLIVSAVIIYLDENRKTGKAPSLFGDTPFVKWMLFLRSFLGYFGIAFSFLAVEYIAIGDSTVLVMMSPVIAAMAGFVMLGEPWRIPELSATILSIVGGVLVAKPPFIFGYEDSQTAHSEHYYLGVFYSLIAAFGAGFAYVFVRILGTSAKMPWANVTFSQAIAQIVLSIPNMYLFRQRFSLAVRWEVYALVTLGACVGCLSQIAMTVGMQREKSASASAMRMSDVVFGFIWQALFTTDPVSWLSVMGAFLVTSGIIIIITCKAPEVKASSVQDLGGEIQLTPMPSGLYVASSGAESSKSMEPLSAMRSWHRILNVGLRSLRVAWNRNGDGNLSQRRDLEYSRLPTAEDQNGE